VSLLRDIQDAAVDGSTDIATVLRKCKVLATRLGNEKFSKWVDAELSGYASVDDLPEYRILSVNSLGHFSGPFNSGLRNAPLPMSCVPEEFREGVRHSYLTAPISNYVALINSDGDGTPQENWPADLVAYCQDKFVEGMALVSAWKLIPRNTLVGVVDTVRNRILSFVLEIEAVAPDAGEADPTTQRISSDQVGHVFNTYIAGSVQNLAAGSSDFTQSATSVVQQGDFDSLARHLAAFDVEAGDLEDLRVAIHTDAAGSEPFGERVRAWMAGMVGKAASGAWAVGLGAAGTLLGQALARYFGLG